MNYFETFSELKEVLEKAKIKKSEGHLAIQVCISDSDSAGIFYIEDFGDRILAEPYDYYDNDVEIIGQAEVLKKLFEKKLDLAKASQNGDVTVNGNFELLEGFLGRISKPAAKKATTTKKTTKASSTAKKSTSKKTEVKKMTDDTKNKDVKKDSEPIKEVVEKEIKPKK